MRECRTLEFKSEVSKTFLKTVSAYANFGTGAIVFGVADDGTVVGLDNPEKACLEIENSINDSLIPRPRFTLEIDGVSRTVTLIVKEGSDKPYLCKGKAYRRSDSSTIEVDKLELSRLVLEGEHLNFEDLPHSGSPLSFNYLEKRLVDAIGISALSEDLLKTLGLLDSNGHNNAAAMLADENAFPGVDLARLGDNEDIIFDRKSTQGVSILQSFDTAMEFFDRYLCYEKISGAFRQVVETVPRPAFREAVANALAHRVWDVPAPIRISVTSDKVEVLSPGGIVSGMSVKSFLEGRYSMLRNPILAEVLFRLGIIEKFGTGVKRIKRAYEGLGKSPSFEMGDDFICVTLPVLSGEPILSPDEALVFSCIPATQLVSRAAIDEATGFEKTKTVRLLNSLLEKGFIQSEGEARARKYSRS